MSNFVSFFENNPSVPVTLILEPLLKQIAVSENATYFWNTFDFEFFQHIAKHPKLTLQNGLQLIDQMAKIYLNDLIFASAASNPLMLVASKFHESEPVKDFLLKFVTICMTMLSQLEKPKDTDKNKKQSTLKKSRDQVALEAKEALNEQDRKFKKSLIVEILRKL